MCVVRARRGEGEGGGACADNHAHTLHADLPFPPYLLYPRALLTAQQAALPQSSLPHNALHPQLMFKCSALRRDCMKRLNGHACSTAPVWLQLAML